MGAALHLAHVHQPPPGPKRKRKDGDDDGPNEQLGKFVRRIYQDERADHESKELLVSLAYALTIPREDGITVWKIAKEALGKDRIGRWRLIELIQRDAPCYKSPALFSHRRDGELYQKSSAPRLRTFRQTSRPGDGQLGLDLLSLDESGQTPQGPRVPQADDDFRNRLGICGNEATEYAVEKLPETGWHRVHWFCTRHRDAMQQKRRHLAEPNKLAPAPVPNWGGLMPCYFDTDWEYLYRFYLGENWQPPVYGLRADDWPVPGKEPVPQRARLRLAAVDGELLGGAL
jgi:hypothetical protein